MAGREKYPETASRKPFSEVFSLRLGDGVWIPTRVGTQCPGAGTTWGSHSDQVLQQYQEGVKSSRSPVNAPHFSQATHTVTLRTLYILI
jgi:hypothetical protein